MKRHELASPPAVIAVLESWAAFLRAKADELDVGRLVFLENAKVIENASEVFREILEAELELAPEPEPFHAFVNPGPVSCEDDVRELRRFAEALGARPTVGKPRRH